MKHPWSYSISLTRIKQTTSGIRVVVMSKELAIIDDSSRRSSAEQESPEVAVPSLGQLKIQQIHHAGFMAWIQFVSQYIALNAKKLT
jgi:hypothetical protein